jgi:hypothetical protein
LTTTFVAAAPTMTNSASLSMIELRSIAIGRPVAGSMLKSRKRTSIVPVSALT